MCVVPSGLHEDEGKEEGERAGVCLKLRPRRLISHSAAAVEQAEEEEESCRSSTFYSTTELNIWRLVFRRRLHAAVTALSSVEERGALSRAQRFQLHDFLKTGLDMKPCFCV